MVLFQQRRKEVTGKNQVLPLVFLHIIALLNMLKVTVRYAIRDTRSIATINLNRKGSLARLCRRQSPDTH
jgi:hypothetical protein